MNPRLVDLDAWHEIFGAYRAAHVAIEQSLAGPVPDLGGLAVLLRNSLQSLRPHLPSSLKDSLLVPLAFLLDEQILARLAATGLEVTWPLLGRVFGKTDFGGDVFFTRADELVDLNRPPALLIQVYLFCLDEGFVGRYASDSAKLMVYRGKLFQKLAPVPPPGALAAARPFGRGPRPLWQFAALALLGATSWLFMLWLVSARL